MSSEKYYDALSGGNDLTKTGLKNIAASVRQRLLNKSRSDEVNRLTEENSQLKAQLGLTKSETPQINAHP